MTMQRLTKAAVLKAPHLATEDVEVPEWGGVVTVRALSGSELDAWRQEWRVKDPDGTPVLKPNGDFASVDDDHPARSFARLVVRSVVGEGGTLMFGPDDLLLLTDQPYSVLKRLGDKALELSYLDPVAQARLAAKSTAQSGD